MIVIDRSEYLMNEGLRMRTTPEPVSSQLALLDDKKLACSLFIMHELRIPSARNRHRACMHRCSAAILPGYGSTSVVGLANAVLALVQRTVAITMGSGSCYMVRAHDHVVRVHLGLYTDAQLMGGVYNVG